MGACFRYLLFEFHASEPVLAVKGQLSVQALLLLAAVFLLFVVLLLFLCVRRVRAR